MSHHTVETPDLGHPDGRATIVQWYRAVGETVTEGDPLVTLETDKVDTEISAPVSGTIVEIRYGEGMPVAAEDVLCVIATSLS